MNAFQLVRYLRQTFLLLLAELDFLLEQLIHWTGSSAPETWVGADIKLQIFEELALRLLRHPFFEFAGEGQYVGVLGLQF